MDNEWSEVELDVCSRTYLWMRDSERRGFKPIKSRINDALRSGPLSTRSKAAVEYRFQNISSVLDELKEPWIAGYKPLKNVGADSAAKIIAYVKAYAASRHARRLNWLIKALPKSTIQQAVSELAAGKIFSFPDSAGYDLVHQGIALPPKKVIGYAGLLHYGAPLFPDNFSGGEQTICFKRLERSGFLVGAKVAPATLLPEQPGFREEVRKRKQNGFVTLPTGNMKPKKLSVTSIAYQRDPAVVAFVETRAKGVCELCDQPAPFLRKDGTPFLEVHHIDLLAEGGADTIENAAGLCPNCHRACHYGADGPSHRESLKARISKKSNVKSNSSR